MATYPCAHEQETEYYYKKHARAVLAKWSGEDCHFVATYGSLACFFLLLETDMGKYVYYIDQTTWVSHNTNETTLDGTSSFQGVLRDITPSLLVEQEKAAEEDLTLPGIYIEGPELLPKAKWTGYCFAFPRDLRCGIAKVVSEEKASKSSDTLKEIEATYDEVVNQLRERLCSNPLPSTVKFVVAKSLSVGDVCVLCQNNDCAEDEVIGLIEQAIQSMSWNHNDGTSLDTPDEEIDKLQKRILHRFDNTYLIQRNSHYHEYKELIQKLMIAPVGSNDRRIYMLLLCALLLRAILDESSVRWIYESGELKYESIESMIELSRAHELHISGFDKFLQQAIMESPDSDQVWSLFFITKSLLSSIVGRGKTTDAENWRYCNFFGFVPYIDNAYQEVTSYYPIHISPDYCYGFLSIPLKNRFQLWSYFPAYIHEFFHYVPPLERRERNEKILHLSIYSVMVPLFIALPAAGKDTYERIVSKIAFEIDNLRHDLIDIRNDFVGDTPVSHQNCEQFRDSMKYIAIMQDLVYLVDFEDICNQVTSELNIDKNAEWKSNCISRWERYMTSYIATFSFALREIRSDLSMCVLLDIDLETYITLLAAEPAFAEGDGKWVADSTVLRFGFMTRLLYVKGDQPWHNVDWKKLCDDMCSTTSSILDWERECKEIIQSLSVPFNDNLCDYLREYIDINVENEDENDCELDRKWNSVFEQALCTTAYAIQSSREDCTLSSPLKIEDIDPRSLIYRWGWELQQIKKYPFVNMLSDLYKEYLHLSKDQEKHYFEYRSRLLFRDLLMYFPDIDLNI